VRTWCSFTLLLALTGPATAGELNLYEWLAVAPVVVVGENLRTYGKYADFRVEVALRGDLAPSDEIRVNVRRANRDRNRIVDRDALRFDKGLSYALLLVPVPLGDKAPPTFEFARGVRGGRELPAEGRAAWLDAAARLVEIQRLNDDRHTWRQFGEMVESTNPVLLDTALEMLVKFRRGDHGLLGELRPLLDHPSGRLRELTATLIGQILAPASGKEGPPPDAEALQSELAARARRDPAVPVRVAATLALGSFDGEEALALLEAIALEDPDQEVRYAAARLVHERRPPAGGPDPEAR
jgi:hypothetical protein